MTDPIIRQMIEESGERWAAADIDRSEPRNAVIITEHPSTCWRLTIPKGSDEWVAKQDTLTSDETQRFYAEFGAHWGLVLNSLIEMGEGKYVRIRKFIMNGNHTRRWSFSIDYKNPLTMKAEQAA